MCTSTYAIAKVSAMDTAVTMNNLAFLENNANSSRIRNNPRCQDVIDSRKSKDDSDPKLMM